MTAMVIQILLITVVSFVVLTLIKFAVHKYNFKVNNYVYLIIGVIFTLVPAVLKVNTTSIVYLVSTPLGLAFLLAFFEFQGWYRRPQGKQVKKQVIRPKAKPNRVKQLNKNKDK